MSHLMSQTALPQIGCFCKLLKRLVRPAGFEPATPCLEVPREIVYSFNFRHLRLAPGCLTPPRRITSAPQAHPLLANNSSPAESKLVVSAAAAGAQLALVWSHQQTKEQKEGTDYKRQNLYVSPPTAKLTLEAQTKIIFLSIK